MSLTNDMLQNLENKNQRSLIQTTMTQDLHSSPTPQTSMKNFLYFLLFILILLFIYDFFSFDSKQKTVAPEVFTHKNIVFPTKESGIGDQKSSVLVHATTQNTKQTFTPNPTLPTSSQNTYPSDTSIVTTPTQESIEDSMDQQYDNALALIAKNHVNQAINALQNIIQTLPEDEQARLALATLLLQRNENVLAISVIQTGLQYEPSNPSLTTLFARALINENQYAQALQALQGVANALSDDPNYLGLLATTYQHLNKPNDAIAIYQKLLSRDPNNGRDLIALGVSYEQASKPNEAILAYKKALSDLNLPITLQNFATNRIALLGGN